MTIAALGVIMFVAAVVNGALGYGFSSITVPLALIFVTSRVLNPALVSLELSINLFAVLIHRRSVGAVLRRTSWIIAGIAPGIFLGSRLLGSVDPLRVKLVTYVVLAALILLQRARKASSRGVSVNGLSACAFGLALGTLYALTTISGPPLSLVLLASTSSAQEFVAALSVVRLVLSAFSAASYGWIGLLSWGAVKDFLPLFPVVFVGMALGFRLIRRVNLVAFKSFCLTFDFWIIVFGLIRVLGKLGALPALAQGIAVGGIVLTDAFLQYRKRTVLI